MNDKAESVFRPVTGQDLARFHLATGVGIPKCWVCGHGSWHIQSSEDVITNAMPWLDVNGRSTGSYFSALVLSCTNCGTLWSIDYHKLRQWLAENPQ